MTPEQQRIAIAEACGWTNVKNTSHSTLCPLPMGNVPKIEGYAWTSTKHLIPDYLSDLNAMHEAFCGLGLIQQIEFHHHLYNVVRKVCAENIDEESVRMVAVNAKPSQRAEALLRTLNLWTDD